MNINEMKVEDLNKIITICNMLIKKENIIKESTERIESMIKQFEIIDTKEEDIKRLIEEVKDISNDLETKKEESLRLIEGYEVKIDTSKIDEQLDEIVKEYKPNTNQLKNDLDDIVKGYKPNTEYVLEDIKKIEDKYEVDKENIERKIYHYISNYKIDSDEINKKVIKIIDENKSYKQMIGLRDSLNKYKNGFIFLTFLNIFILGMNYLTNKSIENFVLKNDIQEIILTINNDKERIDKISKMLWSNDLIKLNDYDSIKK